MRAVPVRLYTQVSELEPVAWSWVDEQLRDARRTGSAPVATVILIRVPYGACGRTRRCG